MTPIYYYPIGATANDVHARRPGEPVGYVPVVGDMIRYAMRHSKWDETGRLVPGWPARDAQGPWSPVVQVVAVYRENGVDLYSCVEQSSGWRWVVQLDWYVAELVVMDGALW